MNILQRIGIMFLCLCMPLVVSANEDIEISVSSDELEIGEMLNIQIDINLESIRGEISLDVPGIDSFQVFSQSQGQSYQSVNGETEGILQYVIGLRALTQGDYSIGPVTIFSGTGQIIDDEVLEVRVVDSTVPIISSSREETIEDTGEEQQTEIRPLRKPEISYVFYGLLFTIFLVGFYIILQKVFSQKEEETITREPEVQKEDRNAVLLHYFQKLGRNSETLSSQDFFTQLNTGVREIFSHEGWNFSTKATLKELELDETLKNHRLFESFQTTYNYEFSGEDIGYDIKKKYIKEIISYLQ